MGGVSDGQGEGVRGAAPLMASARTGTGSDHWRTPECVLDRVRQVAPIGLDPCASPDGEYWFAECNWTVMAFDEDWGGYGLAYVNPPYSQCRAWLERCAQEARHGLEVIALVPARTDTRAWHESVFGVARAVCFWRGRIRFVDAAAGAPFPSAVVYWGRAVSRFHAAFGEAGEVVHV